MRFLLVVKQERNAATFLETLRVLVERGHTVTLAIQERDDGRNARIESEFVSERFQIVPCPSERTDQWAAIASLLRRLRDSVHYLRPALRSGVKLRERMFQKLTAELMSGTETETALARLLEALPPPSLARLATVFELAEHSLPTASVFDAFLADHRPDVLVVSPLVHFGSAQADVVASARAAGIPVWMLLYSWDNLSTKGCLHRRPDLMFVWNEQQRREAETLHGYSPERVVVAGAPRFDAFFALAPAMTREQFHTPLGLDPSAPTLLYLCSSRLIAEAEFGFISRWVQALRASDSNPLRTCNVIVRPHPDIDVLPKDAGYARQQWPAAPGFVGWVARPFGDSRVVVLRTSHRAPEGLFESITHSSAVVGLNTTAELEAGIAGRPVFTITSGEQEGEGQAPTVHFHYLTKPSGGFVSVARNFTDHLAHLDEALRDGVDPAPIRAFVQAFLRPHGIDRPVAPLLATLLEERAAAPLMSLDAELPLPHANGDDRAPAPAPASQDVLPLRFEPVRIWVRDVDEARRRAIRGAIPLDKATVSWLEHHVRVGDVVYDINAGIGTYTLIAAMHRAAVAVAFEPGFRAYGALCDNLLLNRCEGSVIPLAVALSDRDALAELKYQGGRAGESRYSIRTRPWRLRSTGDGDSYVQPACVSKLDTVVTQYGLPAPRHLRLSPHSSARAILDGARSLLERAGLATIYFCASPDEETPLLRALGGKGWSVAWRRPLTGTVQLVVAR